MMPRKLICLMPTNANAATNPCQKPLFGSRHRYRMLACARKQSDNPQTDSFPCLPSSLLSTPSKFCQSCHQTVDSDNLDLNNRASCTDNAAGYLLCPAVLAALFGRLWAPVIQPLSNRKSLLLAPHCVTSAAAIESESTDSCRPPATGRSRLLKSRCKDVHVHQFQPWACSRGEIGRRKRPPTPNQRFQTRSQDRHSRQVPRASSLPSTRARAS